MVNVVLVFPPLVESNFGMIYPSTPVLAAYLEERGIGSRQVDLNSKFLQHVLEDEELPPSSQTVLSRSRLASVGAARWARRNVRSGLLSPAALLTAREEGGHPLDNIVRLLVAPYSVDPDRRILDGCFDDPPLLAAYDRFFAARLPELLPDGSAPGLLGISVAMGPQLLPALRLASAVRRTVPAGVCRVVLGGPTLSLLDRTALARLLLSHSAIDCIVRFDGEHGLYALAEQIGAGRWKPWEVAGSSSVREGVVEHSDPEKGPNLNSLPTPLYPEEMVAAARHGALAVTQARGCYWGKCDYCDFVEVYQGSARYRGRAPERVVDDIGKLIAGTGVRRYRIITESIPPAFARQFSRLLKDRRLDIRWSSFAMVDPRFGADLLGQMAASGCEYLVIGMESMVTRVLQKVHKSATREENLRFLADARVAGIRLSVNLIPNLPSTTREEAFQGLRDLESVADCMDHVKIFEFEPTRSSGIGRAPGSFGLVPLDRVKRAGHAQLALNTLPAADPAMTTAELMEVLRAYRAFAARVNARHGLAAGDTREDAYIELIESADGPWLVDFRTMSQIRFPRAAG